MRKLYLISLILLLSLSVEAKSPHTAHQFYIGYGVYDFSYLEILNPFTKYDLTARNINGMRGIGMIEYRQVRKGFGFGLALSIRDVNEETWHFLTEAHFNNFYRFTMVLPHIEYFWVAHEKYVVSSQLGLGYRMVHKTRHAVHLESSQSSISNSLAFQISPLIVSFGNRNWQGRFDLGIGHRGFGALGLVYQL